MKTLGREEISQVLRGEPVVRDDTGGAGPGADRPAAPRAEQRARSGRRPAPIPEPQPGV